jgi:mycothiol synthase
VRAITPQDLHHRRLTPADLDDVCRVLAASDLAVVGFVDFTPDEVSADLRRTDLEAYGWYDDAGTLRGYGSVARTADSNQGELDLYVHPDHDAALGHAALAMLEARGRELVRAVGQADPWFGVGVYRADTRTRAWLDAAGYEVRTTFTRMRTDLDPASPVRVPPTDVVVRPATDEADLRTAYEIEEESFVEHYGHVRGSYQRWRQRLTENGDDWARVFLGQLGGEPLGVLVTTRQFEPDEDAGYVRTLGVLPAGRGKGIATALLLDCFAAAQRAGRKAVLLHVDVANVTGALRLYESVGMRPVLEIDALAKGHRAD